MDMRKSSGRGRNGRQRARPLGSPLNPFRASDEEISVVDSASLNLVADVVVADVAKKRSDAFRQLDLVDRPPAANGIVAQPITTPPIGISPIVRLRMRSAISREVLAHLTDGRWPVRISENEDGRFDDATESHSPLIRRKLPVGLGIRAFGRLPSKRLTSHEVPLVTSLPRELEDPLGDGEDDETEFGDIAAGMFGEPPLEARSSLDGSE